MTLLQRTDPARADAINQVGAAACRDSASVKKVALSLGVSDRRARQMQDGDRTSLVSRFLQYIAGIHLVGGTPWPLIAAATSIALQSTVIGMTNDALTERFWQLVERESVTEGVENLRSATLARSPNMKAFADALDAENGTQLELSAVTRELDKRGLRPAGWTPLRQGTK